MPGGIEQNKGVVLAHWNYTSHEWKCFIRCSKLSHGRLHYYFYYLFGRKHSTIPDITITGQKVWTGDSAETFVDVNKYIKRINIRESGKINILEITYITFKNGTSHASEIMIPVPLGKLKEAIQVQERLMERVFEK